MACCSNNNCGSASQTPDARYRRVLWVALVLNGGMFLTEIIAGLAAGSAALQADAVDFLSDAANYGISLSVIGLALVWRSRAALVKGVSMGLLGLWVAGNTIWHAVTGTLPQGAKNVCRLRVISRYNLVERFQPFGNFGRKVSFCCIILRLNRRIQNSAHRYLVSPRCISDTYPSPHRQE